ncbi:ras-specific guanine nucleotide-releasing factor 2-like isoform X3 [Daktulosphaira vitifoliae]|uniref:ras-specific guanine nucleotide-releasing factor 2-like isoform X3 n=1 Tax=Daktulosphaira vitifoliae TaxID=58002 RepID=UPI0021A99082|nr:ras-specific guanine nucleotide-releasing factor 2-like isoform X3 [Daktulosphaira vitifoliae]
MLSPKMQRCVRVVDNQLLMLSDRARTDSTLTGNLHKKVSDSGRWKNRYFVLYQNILFYYDHESCTKPSGVILLEGSYCSRLDFSSGASKLTGKIQPEKEHCFVISYNHPQMRQYEFRASSETACKTWVNALKQASFNKLLLQKEELEQRHLHLLQVVESEMTAKWQYTQQCEELASEIKKLRAEVLPLKKELKPMNSYGGSSTGSFDGGITGSFSRRQSKDSFIFNDQTTFNVQDSIEMRKIKKVQSFFRGWLCRRRWKQIVEQYIKSPHAESMRKRNSLVFRMVEAEEEYVGQLEVLVTCFLRPLRMAASSKKPPCTHEDISSIFLNSETVLFLHQIFYKGLTTRMENWPTLILSDLFDILLPMLTIYQEYVRNHHYSLQVLTECKQNPAFVNLLERLENKPACHARSLENFLIVPMHQIPRYIITLHEILAHTPHDHVERKSLQMACQKLEDLSRQIHDEVSETENLRKNLSIERMIIEGCDILLDVNQIFVRQGTLVQIPTTRKKSRIPHFKSEKEAIRQCFLFTNHMIITTRTTSGKLHLAPEVGKISLAECRLIEDPNEKEDDNNQGEIETQESNNEAADDSAGTSHSSDIENSDCEGLKYSSSPSPSPSPKPQNYDFQLYIDCKSTTPLTVHLYAPSLQEKTAWVSDISQCIENLRFDAMLRNSMSDTSSVTMPHSMRNDPKLFKDDKDIKFSKYYNSCRIPRIHHATKEKLISRLVDLRFLSIDFLNTFLLTYRVFTDGVTILEALKKVFYNNEVDIYDTSCQPSSLSVDKGETHDSHHLTTGERERRRSSVISSPRRTSAASSVSGYCSEISERDRSSSVDYQQGQRTGRKYSFRKLEEEERKVKMMSEEYSSTTSLYQQTTPRRKVSIRIEDTADTCHLAPPTMVKATSSSSNETLTGDNQQTVTAVSPCSNNSNNSSSTLVAATSNLDRSSNETTTFSSSKVSPPERKVQSPSKLHGFPIHHGHAIKIGTIITDAAKEFHPEKHFYTPQPRRRSWFTHESTQFRRKKSLGVYDDETGNTDENEWLSNIHSASSSRSASLVNSSIAQYFSRRKSFACTADADGCYSSSISQRTSMQHDSPLLTSRAGVVITSSRQSKRRTGRPEFGSSTSTAAAAFAIATSASSNPRELSPLHDQKCCSAERKRKESVMSTAATMRVLNVLKHWISKHPQDFENEPRLKNMTIDFLEDILFSPNLLPAEHKIAGQLLRLLTMDETKKNIIDLNMLLIPTQIPSIENIDTLSALEIAEQMTYIDHQIFIRIQSQEFFGRAWMKDDKNIKAPHIILMTKRFNEISQLVASEIMRKNNIAARVVTIEKWAAVADISKCLHNFNGVLQICSAFTNSSVFRLKKTWEKVSKATKQSVQKLQIIVSSDGRFRNLREALHRCDPPCIPYLGMYLSDLSFLEEGTPSLAEDGLLNFSKLRMIAHVVQEIRRFQQTPYKIDFQSRVANYLLDTSFLMNEDELYTRSLEIEPRPSRLSITTLSNTPHQQNQ